MKFVDVDFLIALPALCTNRFHRCSLLSHFAASERGEDKQIRSLTVASAIQKNEV